MIATGFVRLLVATLGRFALAMLCGIASVDGHDPMRDGHAPVPMGCTCHYDRGEEIPAP